MAEEKEVTPKLKPAEVTSMVYVALKGLSYGDPEIRVEPGEDARNLPAAEIQNLLAIKAIEPKKAVK